VFGFAVACDANDGCNDRNTGQESNGNNLHGPVQTLFRLEIGLSLGCSLDVFSKGNRRCMFVVAAVTLIVLAVV
jgi:hypothetical protein